MAAPQISALPPAPSRADDGANFSAKADAFVAALATFRTQANTQADYTDAQAFAADADAVATAADRVQTGLDAQATAADVVQTGLDRAQTGADRVQTGLDRVAVSSDRSAVNAALAGASAMTVSYASTYSDAQVWYPSLADGAIVYIVADERYTPARSTFNRVNKDANGSLSLDFTTAVYQSDEILTVQSFARPQVLDVPANSAAPGFLGAVAMSGDDFYFHNGTAWRRVTGVNF